MSSFFRCKTKEQNERLIKEASKASEVAISKLVLTCKPNSDKKALAERLLKAAISASADVFVNAAMDQKREELEQNQGSSEPPTLSEELQGRIDEMNTAAKPHVDVFPPAPLPDQLAIPTGGLAKCQCSPGCTKELPQPAYRIIGQAEREERWCIPSARTPVEALAELMDIVSIAPPTGQRALRRRLRRH